MEVVKQLLNLDIITITNPLKTIEKLILRNYQKPFENKTIRAIATNNLKHRTQRSSVSVWFKNMQLMLIEKITNILC